MLNPQRLASAPPNPALRAELEALAAREGVGVLHARLREVDEAAANRLHPNDVMRVTRAIEVAQLRLKNVRLQNEGNENYSKNESQSSAPEYSAFALEWPREKLYARVDERVEAMLRDGFLEELSTLLAAGFGEAAPLQSLGYKQMRAALENSACFEEALEIWKRQTRRYAKRQITWFRHQLDVQWIAAENSEGEICSAREIAQEIVENFLNDSA